MGEHEMCCCLKSRRVGEILAGRFLPAVLLVLPTWPTAGKPGLSLPVLHKLDSMVLRSQQPENIIAGPLWADSMGRGNAVEVGVWEMWLGTPLGAACGLCRECNGCVGPSVQVTSLPLMSTAHPIRSCLRSRA